MAVIARDIFSGDADPDIDGRVPDGGLEPETGVGAWSHTEGAGLIAVVPGTGAQPTTLTLVDFAQYALTGLTLTDTQWLVRATVDWHGSTVAGASIQGNYRIGPVSGAYIGFDLSIFHSLGEWHATLGVYTDGGGGTFVEVNAATLSGFDPSVPHTLELTRAGNIIAGAVDDVEAVSYDITLNPDPGTYDYGLTGGSPALLLANFEVTSAKIACTLFEVESQGELPLSACAQAYVSAVYARDYFTGPDDNSIEGRVPDGGGADCLAQGHWHNVAMLFNTQTAGIPQHIEIQGEELVQLSNGAEAWSHEADEFIPGLGNDYTVEIEGYFTELFGTASHYAWISCLARQQTGEAETISFTASGTWVCPQEIFEVTVQCWQGGCSGGGATGTLSAGGGGAGGAYAAKLIPVVPGTSYTVTVGAGAVATTANGTAGGATIFLNGATTLVRASSTGGGGTAASGAGTNGAGGTADTTGSVGTTIVAGQNGATGNRTAGVAGGQGGSSSLGGAQSAAPGDNNVGVTGTAPGGGGSGGKTQNATDRISGAGARGQVNITYGYAGHAKESGYELLFDNIGNFHFIYFVGGIYFHRVELANPVLVVAGQKYRVRLCCKGSTFCCTLDDKTLIVTHATEWEEGSPGVCMMGGNAGLLGGTLYGRVTKWQVSSDEANAPLCGGEGGSHGGGGRTTSGMIWMMQDGAWREVPAPATTSLTRFQALRLGAHRQIKSLWGFFNGAWRLIVGSGGDTSEGGLWNGNPGDTMPDPGCGQVPTPEIPSVPLIPLEDKLFFCYNLPIEGATDPFDTAVWAMGEWMPSYLAICQARGLRLIGGVGGYSRFFTGGVYDPDKMDAVIAGHAGFMDTVAGYADLGIFYGQLIIDDYHSALRWGTVISLDEVNRIAGVWKSHYPWIRTVLRDTPSNVNSYGSNTLSNVDTFLAQYVTRYGNVSDWMNNQIDLASGHFGGKAILWSLNFKHPSGMTSPPMTAAQVLDYGMPLAEQPYSHGLGGWMYDLRFLNQPGVVNALSTLRNTMAGVP